MPNLVYQNEESPITWLASGGTNAFTLTSLGIGAGRQGALHDFGVAARPRLFVWRFWMKFATAPVVNEYLRVYLKTSDGSHPDNDDGTGDIAVSAEDKLKNLKYLGPLVVDEASATPEFATSGFVEISARHAGPVVWNSTTDGLSGTAADHGFSLTPVPDEIQ